MGKVADRLAAIVGSSVPRASNLLTQAADTFYGGADAALSKDLRTANRSMDTGTKQMGKARRLIDAAVAGGLQDC